MLTPWKKSYEQPRQHIKKQRYYFADKGPSHQGYGFSSGHVWMWELDYKESWVPKNLCLWTVVLDLPAVQGTLKSLLQHHSSKASILHHSALFTVQLSHPYMTTGKTIALMRRTFVGKVISLLFNMLSRLVITFLPRSVFYFHGCSHHLQWFRSPEK